MPASVALLALLSLSATDVEQRKLEPAGPAGAAVPAQGRWLFTLTEVTHPVGFSLLVSAATCVGLGKGFDLGLAVDHSLSPLFGNGALFAGHLTSRFVLTDTRDEASGRRWRTALTADVSGALFTGSPGATTATDPRSWTGLRNYNAELGLAASSDSTVSYFMRVAVLVSVDTQPESLGPLQGLPPPWSLGASGVLEGGSAINSQLFHATFGLRLMLHSRLEDERITVLSFLGVALG